MTWSTDRPSPGPHTLVIRAVFVPAGEQPPPEFSTAHNRITLPATLDPKTGAIVNHAFVVFLYGVFSGAFETLARMGISSHHLCT